MARFVINALKDVALKIKCRKTKAKAKLLNVFKTILRISNENDDIVYSGLFPYVSNIIVFIFFNGM